MKGELWPGEFADYEKRYCESAPFSKCGGRIKNVCIDDNYETQLCTRHIQEVKNECDVTVYS